METFIAGIVGLLVGAFLTKGIQINYNHNVMQETNNKSEEEEELQPVYVEGVVFDGKSK